MSEKRHIKDVIKEIQDKKYGTRTQEVKPVYQSINKDMVQCNFDIHPDLKKKLKLKALEDGVSFKETITAAIQHYLNTNHVT